jgi:hypothetical protein
MRYVTICKDVEPVVILIELKVTIGAPTVLIGTAVNCRMSICMNDSLRLCCPRAILLELVTPLSCV